MGTESRNAALQSLARDYLHRLCGVASRYGLGGFVGKMIADNAVGKCVATESEVAMLSRCVDEERVSRSDVPAILGKSYRQCNEDGDFDAIRKLHRVGIYSFVSTVLHKEDINDNNGNGNVLQ
jgi:hypothetical protein